MNQGSFHTIKIEIKVLKSPSKMSIQQPHCQKQPSRGVPRKRCSENMQRIYRRTPMPKCDFNKVALQIF